jgi:hypothetical protein
MEDATDKYIHLPIGLEHITGIIADLDQALAAAVLKYNRMVFSEKIDGNI